MPRVLPGIEVNGGRLAADECRAIIVGICAFAGLGPPRSVLICDDRPAARQGLVELLRPLSSVSEIRCVADGFSLVDAVAGEPVDLVLIGVHRASQIGPEAIDLVLGMHPSTVIIVVGSAGDIDVLARAYLRGPRGMLLWEPSAAPWN
jgi:DNA-binding NarL/FixJ family response regulator